MRHSVSFKTKYNDSKYFVLKFLQLIPLLNGIFIFKGLKK